MQTDMLVDIGPSELAQVVAEVFETMMGLQVASCEAAWKEGPARLSSAVSLSGEWNGTIVIECNADQARRFAGRFLSQDPPAEVDDVVRDVAGELANMVGGNLKCVLLPGIRISMPSVVDGSRYSLRVCGSSEDHIVAFDSDEGVFWVRVLHQREE